MQQEEQSICTVTPSFNRKNLQSAIVYKTLFVSAPPVFLRRQKQSLIPLKHYTQSQKKKKKRQRARVKPYRTSADE